jgi:hypothetical protein
VEDGRLVEAGLPVNRMLDLIEGIEASRCGSGLYTWQSMDDLCIVQTPVRSPDDGPYLRISPLLGGKFAFRYIDTIKRPGNGTERSKGLKGLLASKASLINFTGLQT